MHQLNLKLPITAERSYPNREEEAPRAFSRGVVFLAFSGLAWLVVWVALRLLFSVLGGHH